MIKKLGARIELSKALFNELSEVQLNSFLEKQCSIVEQTKLAVEKLKGFRPVGGWTIQNVVEEEERYIIYMKHNYSSNQTPKKYRDR